jgi:hypothetical protein
LIPASVEPPAMTWEEHEAIQQKLIQNKALSRRNAKRDYLFTGMIRCRRCDCAMRGWANHQGKYLWYVCPRCDVKYRLAELEARVWSQVQALLSDPARYMAQVRQKDAAADQTRDSLLRDISSYERRLKAVLEKEKKAATAWLSDMVSAEALEQVRAFVRAERAHCEEMIDLAKGRLKALDRVAVTVKSMEALGQKIGDKLDQADFAQRRWVLGQMCAMVRIDPEQESPDDVELEVSLDAVEPQTPDGKGPDVDIVSSTPGY